MHIYIGMYVYTSFCPRLLLAKNQVCQTLHSARCEDFKKNCVVRARARKLKICRIVVSHDHRTKLELSSARCGSQIIRLNNLFASALRNGSGNLNRIVLLSAKTNPSVGFRRKMHKRPANKPVGAQIQDYQGEEAS